MKNLAPNYDYFEPLNIYFTYNVKINFALWDRGDIKGAITKK